MYIDNILDEFTDLTAPILERIGPAALEKIILTSLFITRGDRPLFVHLLKRCPGLLERLFAHGDADLVLEVYDLAGEVAESHPSPALMLLDKSPDLLDRVGVEGMVPIARFVGEVAGHSWGIALKQLDRSPCLLDAVLKPAAGLWQLGPTAWLPSSPGVGGR